MTDRVVISSALLLHFFVGLLLWSYADANFGDTEDNTAHTLKDISFRRRRSIGQSGGGRCKVCLNGGVLKISGNILYCACRGTYFGPLCETQCPPTFQLLDNGKYHVGCYKVLISVKTWYDAPKACKRFDCRARLAALDTEEKNNAVKTHLQNYTLESVRICRSSPNAPQSAHFWNAGARKIHQDCSSPFVWKPTGGKEIPLTYQNFGPGRPTCSNYPGKEPRESCLAHDGRANYAWNDAGCDWEFCSVCEIPHAV
jgi:hypothetical protein